MHGWRTYGGRNPRTATCGTGTQESSKSIMATANIRVTFHRSPTNVPMDEQFLAPLSAAEFAQRVEAINRGEHPVETGRRLPPAPPDAPRLDV
jgi:hypothetical protein